MTISSNGNNVRRAHINKVIILNKNDIKKARANIAANVNVIIMIKRKIDANIATTTNLIASNAKVTEW